MPKHERRQDPRSAACSTATLCLGAEALGLFEVLDLSAGGALVRGRCPVRPGQDVKIRLHFSPLELVVEGVVVREEAAGGGAFAVRFSEMEAEIRQCLQSLVELPVGPWAEAPRPRRGSRAAARA